MAADVDTLDGASRNDNLAIGVDPGTILVDGVTGPEPDAIAFC